MKKSGMMYFCVLGSVVLLSAACFTGCEEEGTCFYECADGLVGSIDAVESDEACGEEADETCESKDQGSAAQTEFSTECDDDEDSGEDSESCEPDWY
jgi:hypothetical protein